ncbi:MAG: PQQ-like beta-propeller repeat protein [Gemmataceae bacterium]|nr:PQQ-like beta-propeller repeat protein [Gemmataceae bacterium]MCI0741937.1 PQQ-like beta-propeller repeat protein [Gemmataceae bacterium]
MNARSRLLLVVVLSLSAPPAALADDWPQWLGPKRDSVWRETGIVEKFPADGPKILWRAKIAGGYAGPAVADGRVYLHDFLTEADTKKLSSPQGRPKIEGKERILCLGAKNGDLVWKHEYDCTYGISYPAGPRCTPTVQGGKVYAIGAMGHLHCLDAANGKPLWSKDLPKEFNSTVPIWGMSGHPLVDGTRLICIAGGGDNVVVALDKDTGKESWKALAAKQPGYAPPTLIQAGGKKQLIIWHGEAINGLDPETGKVYWTTPLAPFASMSIMTPRQEGSYLFAGGMGKSLMLSLDKDRPDVKVVWGGGKPKTSVHPVNMTPFLEDGLMYGVDTQGPLMAIKLETGERLWETFKPTTGERPESSATVFLVKNGDRFFLFNEKGELIIAKLNAQGYEEISRAKILEPTGTAFGRDVVWSHPAFAGRCAFVRNDRELVCVGLAAKQ